MSIDTTHRKAALLARLAGLATLVVPLALTALLLCAAVASAAVPPPATHSSLTFEEEEEEEAGEAVEEEVDWEKEGWEEEELGGTDCELAQEGLEEGLLTATDVEDLCAAEKEWEEELEGSDPSPPCGLRKVKAHIVTKRNRLKLTIGYTAAAPTKARIEIRAGKRKLDTVSRRLGRKGVIRLNKRLGKADDKRVRLRFKLPKKAPEPCGNQRLVLFPK